MERKNYDKLIKERGLKKVYVAEQMGISRVTLAQKLAGKYEFTKCEKYVLEAILRGEKID